MADITFDGTTDYPNFSSRSGSTYTLTANVLGGTVTVNSGVTVIENGYIIYGKTAVVVNGTVHANGKNASGSTAGGNSGPDIVTVACIGRGVSGGNGGSPPQAGATTTNMLGGSGGAGGASGSSGGSGGNATSFRPTGGSTPVRCFPFNMVGLTFSFATNPIANVNGGAGGGGGRSNSPDIGGGGGGGGGVVIINSPSVTIGASGVVSARGGNGANATNGGGTGAGGGGGGGGGVIIINYSDSYTNSGTVSVAGGSFGTGVNGGSNGAAGADGLIMTNGP